MKLDKRTYTPAKRDGKFECPVHEVKDGFLFDTLSLLCKSLVGRISFWGKEKVDWFRPEPVLFASQDPVITWIGHATVLIQVAGVNILVDPIFGNSSLVYPRIIQPGIPFEGLPPIDLVLISHNHMDHMEASSMVSLAHKHKAHFFVPQGDKAWFDRRSIRSVDEFCWWQGSAFAGTGVTCTFLPALHWTQRFIFDRNKSLWGSWMIKAGDTCIYFGGDTAFGPHFGDIATEFNGITAAILPIGPCEPRNSMKKAHMDAADAVLAFKALNAGQFIPIHWGTFHFGNERAILPIERLKQNWHIHSADLQHAALHLPKAGQKLYIKPQENFLQAAAADHVIAEKCFSDCQKLYK